ncbi:hypothetical protein M9H77_30657 [Catharanthus roseus]|uniref:Uncharacterized protein n=1 Tax=Catharanthus roseus TaxID=4058 RepID=A0ACB9ZXU8_CATRO|nr:hypothetical protein M9H77_30657 [Catharanthus roseus]
MRDRNPADFRSIKKTTQTGLGSSSSQPVEDDDEADKSYNLSNEKKDEAGAQNMIPMDAFQIELQTAFEPLRINQEIQGMQLNRNRRIHSPLRGQVGTSKGMNRSPRKFTTEEFLRFFKKGKLLNYFENHTKRTSIPGANGWYRLLAIFSERNK